ncbi:D-alanine--D-alanine ligase [Candidatus Parcubacteria bacterium]|nr:D-alanine--D-alanine ligase [Candidatus Parcubacteria bacterium]
MAKKIRVAVVFGGKSAEHEVSLRSAANVAEAIDKSKYEVVPIAIDKYGKWLLPDSAKALLGGTGQSLSISGREVMLRPQSGGAVSLLSGGTPGGVDVVFPILHGPLGEDGTVQGLLTLADVPFVGSGVLGSAVGMDKEIMKRLLRDAGLPIARFITVRASEKRPAYAAVTKKLGKVLFVKPANMGSSVGVSKVKSAKDYTTALDKAFEYDDKILIEEFIPAREVECAVLGNENPIASVVGEIIPSHEFYSYEAKYLDEKGAALEVPAKIPKALSDKIRKMAIEVFKALSCEGLGRVDFFLTKRGKIYVNEINTIPGFTSVSMYPRLFGASGISYPELIDRLIQLALDRHLKKAKLKTTRV